jgi:hypothetical protein
MKLNRLLKSYFCVLAACVALGGGGAMGKMGASQHQFSGSDFVPNWPLGGVGAENEGGNRVSTVLRYLGEMTPSIIEGVCLQTLTVKTSTFTKSIRILLS